MVQILTSRLFARHLKNIFLHLLEKKPKNFVDGGKKGEVKPPRNDRSLPVYKSTYITLLQITEKKSIHFDFSSKALLFHHVNLTILR